MKLGGEKIFPIRFRFILGNISTFLAVLLILFAPIFRGGNRHIPLIGLEWIGLSLCLCWSLSIVVIGRLPASWGQGAARNFLIALVLAPAYLGLLSSFALETHGTPFASFASTLKGIPIIALGLSGLSTNSKQTSILLRAWIWVALIQAILGLMQLTAINPLYFGQPEHEPIIGTFASKNTYSNLLVMALPLAIYGWLSNKVDSSLTERRPWLWLAALFLLLAAISLSTSRTGIVTGLLTSFLAISLLSPVRAGLGSQNPPRLRWIWLSAIALLVSVAATGGLDWIARFDSALLAADDAQRGLMRDATWQGAMTFWPWGSGLGSYRWVFPPFHPPELGNYLIDMAHNDYLQLMMELGIGFVLMAALALALVARRVWALWAEARRRRGKGWCEADRLAVACGLGALATALHALVDYPFHIPANAMFAAFLLGVFLREPLKSTHEAG